MIIEELDSACNPKGIGRGYGNGDGYGNGEGYGFGGGKAGHENGSGYLEGSGKNLLIGYAVKRNNETNNLDCLYI